MPIFANVLQPLINVFEWVLVNVMHDGIGLSWGFSIVGLTIVVRACLLPLAIRQYKSMKAMQRHAPELKALREKYKDNKERLNQEMMKFYQENKVNPFGACLPLVFQLPVFISLFYMLRHDLRLDICPSINPPGTSNPSPCGAIPDAHFLGIPDITDKATGSTLIILLVLYVGTQLISTLIMAQPTMEKNQRYLMMALPVVFVPFVLNFPAGLLVYWITTNVWTLIQQFTIRETLGRRWDRQFEAEQAAKAAELAASGGGTKASRPRPAAAGAGGLPAPDASSGSSSSSGGGMFGRLMARAQEQAETRSAAANGANGTAKAKDADDDSTPSSRPAGPPPSARKKKKRSGRRR
jgi:YidC/Oxa1 family membrane protein insertase